MIEIQLTVIYPLAARNRRNSIKYFFDIQDQFFPITSGSWLNLDSAKFYTQNENGMIEHKTSLENVHIQTVILHHENFRIYLIQLRGDSTEQMPEAYLEYLDELSAQ